MGCCVSTGNNPSTPQNHPKTSKSPPPTNPLLEEETVKEVLSETPTITRQPSFKNHQRNSQSPLIKNAPLLSSADEKRTTRPFMVFNNEDVSQDFSEIGSTHSESVHSVSTDKQENQHDDHDVRRRSTAKFKNRSFSGEVRRNERLAGRSPAKRSDASPGRVGTTRPGTGYGSGRRRDSGERSGRRSRSPVTRNDYVHPNPGLGRTNSARRTGKSPGRVNERIRKVENPGHGPDSKCQPTTNESLENPLVSLECFIFL